MTNAALVMTANILAAIAISDFIHYNLGYVKFGLLLLIPVLAVTRMAIFVSLLLIPLSFIRINLISDTEDHTSVNFYWFSSFFSVPVQENVIGEGK